jgi:DNA repair protein REV1
VLCDCWVVIYCIDTIAGVGYSLKARLAELGVSTCGELQLKSLQLLQSKFGVKTGLQLYNRCRGIDDRVFQVGAARKSVSAEMNYGIRFSSV